MVMLYSHSNSDRNNSDHSKSSHGSQTTQHKDTYTTVTGYSLNKKLRRKRGGGREEGGGRGER